MEILVTSPAGVSAFVGVERDPAIGPPETPLLTFLIEGGRDRLAQEPERRGRGRAGRRR